MKTITFNYQKSNGSKSERTLLAMVEPSNGYAGIDVSELSPVDAARFASDVNELHSAYLSELRKIQAIYDVTHGYKKFLMDGMTDITVI
jgi:hypothetical protein